MRFDHFWQHYHNWIFSYTCVNIRTDLECLALEIKRLRAKKNSALDSVDSDLIFSETTLISADQRWICQFWKALIQREPEPISSEKALNSADVFMFSESALKNVKSVKQRCSALKTSGTFNPEWISFSHDFSQKYDFERKISDCTC